MYPTATAIYRATEKALLIFRACIYRSLIPFTSSTVTKRGSSCLLLSMPSGGREPEKVALTDPAARPAVTLPEPDEMDDGRRSLRFATPLCCV